jgi:hypothetical protein
MNERRTSVEQQCESIKKMCDVRTSVSRIERESLPSNCICKHLRLVWNTAYNTEIALKDKQCGVYKANC